MNAAAQWGGMAPEAIHPDARRHMLQTYLDKNKKELDPLEIRRIEGHLARATRALVELADAPEASVHAD